MKGYEYMTSTTLYALFIFKGPWFNKQRASNLAEVSQKILQAIVDMLFELDT